MRVSKRTSTSAGLAVLLTAGLTVACSAANFGGAVGTKKEVHTDSATKPTGPGSGNKGPSNGSDNPLGGPNNALAKGPIGTLYVPIGGQKSLGNTGPCTTANMQVASCAAGVVTGNKLGSTVAQTTLPNGAQASVNVVVFDPSNPPAGIQGLGAQGGFVPTGATTATSTIPPGLLTSDGTVTTDSPGITSDGTTTLTIAPLKVIIGHDADTGDSGYHGPISITIQNGNNPPINVVTFSPSSGEDEDHQVDQTISVPGVCRCGGNNTYTMTMTANGQAMTLQQWDGIGGVITSHSNPKSIDSDAGSTWERFLKETGNLAGDANTLFLGGWDHNLLDIGTPCPGYNSSAHYFACDHNWDDLNDTMMIFQCDVSSCAGGGAGTQLHFTGEGP